MQVADDHPSKPHPAMIRAALAETGVEAERAVMLGDTVFDIDMAAAAGVPSLGVAWGYHAGAALAEAGAERGAGALRRSDPGARRDVGAGVSGWAARRFWREVAVVPEVGGFALRLDGRGLRTPAKAPLVVPTPALAEAVAEEWRAVGEVVDPRAMPATRAANAALDKVASEREAVVAELAGYGDADLTCYRAEAPEALVARQAEAWDPLLDWAARAHGARLTPVAGVMHRPQDAGALARLAAPLGRADPFALTALSDLVALSGSLVIGLAAVSGAWDPDDLWARSRIDERWQEELWGHDEEAAAAAALKRRDFLGAHRLLGLLAASASDG